ncbi:MAG: hypothetical protein Q8O83_02440 [bacterium]|nr:hypothetical protein [bacterium]
MEHIRVSMNIPKTDKKWEEIIGAVYELRRLEEESGTRQYTYISPSGALAEFKTVTGKGTWVFANTEHCITVSFIGTLGAFATGSSVMPTWRIIEHGAEIRVYKTDSNVELYALWQGKSITPNGNQFPALSMLAHTGKYCTRCNEVALLREGKTCSVCFSSHIKKGGNTSKTQQCSVSKNRTFVIEEVLP